MENPPPKIVMDAAANVKQTPDGSAPLTGVPPQTAKKQLKKKKAPVLDPAELAKLEAERIKAEKQLVAKQAIEDIPHQQMIKSRLVDVKGRNAQLSSSLSTLQSTLHQSDSDSTDVLKYLENEVRRKDILTKKLGKEIKELYERQVEEKTKKNEEYSQEIRSLESTFKEKEKELLEYNKILHQEYNDLLLFQKIREELNSELLSTKAIILKNEKRHALQMSDLEKKFLLARNKLLQESSERIAESRKNYKEEVGRELDLESKFIGEENKKMKSELSFHQTLIEKLQSSNSELESIVQELESSVKALEKKDIIYASNSLRNSKLLSELKTKEKILEGSLEELNTSERDDSLLKKSLVKGPISPDEALYQSLSQELSRYEALISRRKLETQALQSHIDSFQQAQNSVELIFQEVYEQVKVEIVARRKKEYEVEYQAWKDRLRELGEELYHARGGGGTVKRFSGAGGSLSSTTQLTQTQQAGGGGFSIQSDPRLPPPISQETNPKKIRLEDFTLADRERVLQLLFEKLNQSNPVGVDGRDSQHPHRSSFPGASSRSSTSSALSLYTGGGVNANDSSRTSLVVSRPQSSTRPTHRSSSRPASSQRSKPSSAHGGRASAGGNTFVTQADMRPSEFVQIGGQAGLAKINQAAAQQQQQQQQTRHQSESRTKQRSRQKNRSNEEKDAGGRNSMGNFAPFFPPRGDTPTELL